MNLNKLKDIKDIVGDNNSYFLILKGPSGSGKTENIIKFLKDKSSYIVITADISSALTFKSSLTFNNVIPNLILNKPDVSSNKKVITTLDNIRHTSIFCPFDYLVLDDVSYLLTKLVYNTNYDNKEDNVNLLIQLIQQVTKIIISDIHLDQSLINILNKIRNKKDTILYEAECSKDSGFFMNTLDNISSFRSLIKESVLNNHKIVVPIHDERDAVMLSMYMLQTLNVKLYGEDKNPSPDETGYKVKIYTKDDRNRDNLAQEFKLYDCVIYTRVLNYGYSIVYPEPYFDKCIALIQYDTPTHETSQSILRVRQLKTNDIFLLSNISKIYDTSHIDYYAVNNYLPKSVINIKHFKQYVRTNDKLKYEFLKSIDIDDSILWSLKEKDFVPYFEIFCDRKFKIMNDIRDVFKSKGFTDFDVNKVK